MKKLCSGVLILGLLALCSLAGIAMAEEPSPGIADSVFDRVDEAMGRAEKARQVYDRARNLGKPATEVKKAEEDLQKAEGSLREANVKLDTARVNAIADAAGVSPAQVQEMRASGKGWGAIAGELGVHPSVVNRGKGKKAGMSQDGAGKMKKAKSGKKPDADEGAEETAEETVKKKKPGKGKKK